MHRSSKSRQSSRTDVRHLLAAASITILMVLAVSCQQTPQTIQYPDGWPISELTAPPGSKPAKSLFIHTISDNTNGYTAFNIHDDGLEAYGVGFFNARNSRDIVQHVSDICISAGLKDETEYPGMETWEGGKLVVRLNTDTTKAEVDPIRWTGNPVS